MVFSDASLIPLRRALASSWIRGGLCALLFAAGILSWMPAHYATNDDITLLWTLNGGDGYPADAFGLFNSFLLNKALFGLYKAFPAVPWWGVVVYSALTAATALIFSMLFRIGKAALVPLPALLFFLAHLFALPGITHATVLLEVACLLGLCEAALRGAMPTHRPCLYGLALAASLTAAFLMRWEIALFLAVLGLPALIIARSRLRWKIAAVLFLAASALTADRILFSLNTLPSEKAFIRYNALRASFHDIPAGILHPGTAEDVLEKTGWSLANYEFYQNWGLYDDSLFNAQRIGIFLKQNAVAARSLSRLKAIISGFLHNLWNHKKHLCLWGLGLLAVLAWIVGQGRVPALSLPRRRKAAWLPFAVGALALGFFAYYRFVERIYIPIFIFTLAALLLAAERLRHGKSAPKPNWAGNWKIWTALQALLALWLTAGLIRDLHADSIQTRFVSNCLENRVENAPGATWIYLDPVSGLGLENVHPLRERILSAPAHFFPDGFWVGSPRYRGILAAKGYANGRDFLRDAVDNETLSWVLLETPGTRGARAASEILRAWQDYYSRNLGLSVGFVEMASCQDPSTRRLTFYQMTPAGEAGIFRKH